MIASLKSMNWCWLWLALGAGAGGTALAQNAPPAASKSTAQIDAGEPRADTSPGSVPPAASAGPAATSAAGGAAPASAPHPAPRGVPARPAATPGRPGAAASDHVDLGTATVTGDREQPKVMYIVPWKRSDIGDLSGKPMHSLLDEALAPVDRDEFRREVTYYEAVKSTSSQNGAPAPAADLR